jgi:hypothetical protein
MCDPTTTQRTYYGRRSSKSGYDWIVCIDDEGCFVTDPIEDWEKDNDYVDEARSNPTLYEQLDTNKAAKILASWGRTLR